MLSINTKSAIIFNFMFLTYFLQIYKDSFYAFLYLYKNSQSNYWSESYFNFKYFHPINNIPTNNFISKEINV